MELINHICSAWFIIWFYVNSFWETDFQLCAAILSCHFFFKPSNHSISIKAVLQPRLLPVTCSHINEIRRYHAQLVRLSNIQYCKGYAILYYVMSLMLGNVTWRHTSGSTLIEVMACCLTAPCHYLNQCWLIAGGVQGHSHDVNLAGYQSINQSITPPVWQTYPFTIIGSEN